MQWKVCPEQGQSVFIFQSFDTPGDEVAPRSDEITEYFQNWAHSIVIISDLREPDVCYRNSINIMSHIFCHLGLDSEPGSRSVCNNFMRQQH